MAHMNSRVRRYFVSVAKWTLLILVILGVSATVSTLLIVPKVTSGLNQVGAAKITVGADGQQRVTFPNDKTPTTLADELSDGAPQLIYQNQARGQSTQQPQATTQTGVGSQDDVSPDLVQVPPSVRTQLANLADTFIVTWETFSASDTLASYQTKLEPFVDPGYLDDAVKRSDSIQNADIGIGGESGSLFNFNGAMPDQTMRVLSYTGDSAYLSAECEVEYTGPDLPWKGEIVRRSYSLIVKLEPDGQWKVLRAIAQTLSPDQS